LEELNYKYKDIGSEDIYDYAVIKNSVRNILTIPRGSLPDNPNFGTSLYAYLFEILDDFIIDEMQDVLVREVVSQEKRIDRVRVVIKSIPEYHKLTLNIEYYIKDSEVKDFLTMTLRNNL